MENRHLERILTLINEPPLNPPSSRDWLELERDLKVTFCSDYKNLLTSVGDGFFGLASLSFLCPPHRLSKTYLKEYRKIVEYIQEVPGISLFPKAGGWVKIASGPTRVDWFLGPGDDDVYSKLWLIDYDDDEAHSFDGRVSELILKLFDKNTEDLDDWFSGLPDAIWKPDGPFFCKPGKW